MGHNKFLLATGHNYIQKPQELAGWQISDIIKAVC